MFRPTILALATGLLAACATSPGQPGGPGMAAPLSLETMQEVTRTLASDEFEGREPGTPGEEKTVNYLAERFAAAGLQPGNNGSWFQDVPLVEITATSPTPLVVETPSGSSMTYQPATDWVGVSYREQERTSLEDSEIVFVGYGIVAPERGWNDYEGIDMRGKTALILVNDPDYAADSLEGPFNGRAMTFYGRWTYKFEEAARQGAAGALIVHDEYPASYGWSVVESSWTGPQAYAQRADGGADQTQVNGWVQKPVAEAIVSAAGRSLAELSTAATRADFAPVPLGVTVSTSFDNTIRRFASRNVVAMLPGSERPDEYVLHTAHWDHLGRCTPDASGDDICNGAIDNATGTAALVALGEAHAKAGPTARTQVFVAVTAEESGLLGSEYYGANPVFPLDQTVGGVNMDALYMMGEAKNVNVVGGGKSELDAYLARALLEGGRVASADANPQAGSYYRSDHFSLAKRGVPMIYVKPGDDLVDGGTAAGAAWHARYNADAYHAPGDEYDPVWDWGGALQDLGLYYRLGRMLGDSADWPNWYEGDEFRAVRDEFLCRGGRLLTAMTFHMPAEWAPQEWIWIGFPHAAELWEDDLVPAQEEIAAFANAVAETGQDVRLVVRDAATEARAKRLVSAQVRLERHPYGDIWLRDTGPLTLLGPEGGRRAQRFGFNGWGGKYQMAGDQETGASLAEAGGLVDSPKADWILEGGAIDTDGTGLVVTTEQCLLNGNRNPSLPKDEIERRLKRDLGFERICWLGEGLEGDHTDGHVDNLARFVGEKTLAIPVASGRDDPNAAVYDDARVRARAFGLAVRDVPSPGGMGEGDLVEPASFMNFAICNHIVVVPTYGTVHDEEAVAAIGDMFPGRAAIGLRADAVLTGGGSFHCCSQHVPQAA